MKHASSSMKLSSILVALTATAVLGQNDEGLCAAVLDGEAKTFDGCKRIPSSTARVFWTLGDDDTLETLFEGTPAEGGFIAWAWGADEIEGSDATIVYTDADGKPKIGDFHVKSLSPKGIEKSDNQGISKAVAELNDDGKLTGFFVRPLGALDIDDVVNGGWAIGPSLSSEEADPDDFQHGAVPVSLDAEPVLGEDDHSTGDVDDSNGASTSAFSGKWKIHAFAMLFAWLVFVPLGSMTMVYFRDRQPIALYAHIGLQGAAMVLAVAGMVIAIFSGGGLFNGSGLTKLHAMLGWAAFAGLLIQLLWGFFRPKPDSTLRKTFNIVHRVLGFVLGIAGTINVFFGIRISGFGARWTFGALACVIATTLLSLALRFLLSRGSNAKEPAQTQPSPHTPASSI